MKEHFGIKIDQPGTLSRKQELKTEFGQLRHDWFESKGIDLSGKKYSDIKSVIKEFYEEVGPIIKETLEEEAQTLESEISVIAKEKLDFHKVADIRKKLDLPKWVSLPETVAFIKTVLDLDSQDFQERYVEYAAKGISLDDMRNVLAYDNDVKPARLDTDIYHQSPERSRSAVEVVSNAIDAVNTASPAIGRFGVGFYQILSHLKSDKDTVKVRTGNEESGFYEIDFRLKEGEIQTHMRESVDQTDKGTAVELILEDFPKDEAEALIKKHFAYNSVAKVICNGELVNDLSTMRVDQEGKPAVEATITDKGYIVKDRGTGMSPQVILEKLLVPKLSGKKPVQELKSIENIKPSYFVERKNEAEQNATGKAVINVGGVMIEEIELKGINTVKTLVIDLPPFTMLGEERNQVAVDEITILAAKKLTEDMVATGDVEVINSLAQVISGFQQRSFHREKESNLVTYLQDQVEKELPEDKNYLPNVTGFDRLKISNKVLIDPMIKQTNWRSMPEFLRPSLQGNGNFVHIAPLEAIAENPVVKWKNQIILSQDIYEKFKNDPTMVNLFLKAYGQGNGVEVKKLDTKQVENITSRVESRERKEYKDFSEFVAENWEMMKFSSQEIAKDVLDKLSPEQQKAAELVHKHIIEKFPENYTKYFADAVLYNQLPELTEENIINFASLAKSEELPQVLADLCIYPIISREVKINHLKGIVKYDEYNEYNDSRRGGEVRNTRDDIDSDEEREWRNIKYWDRGNLLHRGGQIFPGQSQFSPKSDTFFTWNGREVSIVDGKTRTITGKILLPEYFLGTEYNSFQEMSFGDRQLACIESGGNSDKKTDEFIIDRGCYYDGRGYKEGDSEFYYYSSRGPSRNKPFVIFDLQTKTEFNPNPELGMIIGYVNPGYLEKVKFDKSRYSNKSFHFGAEHSYLIYAQKDDAGKIVLHAYFLNGTYEQITPAQTKEEFDNGIGFPPSVLKTISVEDVGEENRETEKRETEEKEPPFIFGKRPLLDKGYYEDFKKNSKYLYDFTVPVSLYKYLSTIVEGKLVLPINNGILNMSDLAQVEKELYGYKLTQEEIENLKRKNVWDTRFWLDVSYRQPPGLLQAGASLTAAKAESIRRALESSTMESDQKHRRFLNRVFKYAHLSDEAFDSIAGVLLEVDDIESYVLTDELITEAEVRLQKYDSEMKKSFYRAWMKFANPGWSKEEAAVFLGKLSKIFIDKVANIPDADREAMYQLFDTARDYGQEYLVNGWNIVRYRTPVPAHLIPEKIRPLIEFLRADEHSIMAASHERINFNAYDEFTLSKLIQAKRLNESAMQDFSGSSAELAAMIVSKTADKKQNHIQREIIHPIYYQGVNSPYLFIRELVQNAHDAVIKHGRPDEKEVSMDIFSRDDKEVTLRMEDHIGMSLREVLNYFLIPGESTKIREKETIGYFGQGLFTLFRGSKEVTLRTGKGDGLVTKLKISPLKDEAGMTVDLKLNIEQEQGDFKGTVIERTVDTEYPTVEAAYIKNAACTFTSLVNADVVSVKLNNSKINDAQQRLASVEVPELGELSIYDAPNNVVTQRGLFVKSIDHDYTTGMHDVETLLAQKGYVVNIPDNVHLTRSRNEIARKQEILSQMKEYLPLLKLKAYLEIFRQDISKGHVIQLDNLPYDYFYWSYPTEGKIVEDANKLRKGESITDVSNYLGRGDLISLLVLLPVVEIDDKAWSLAELKEASLNNKPPLEDEKKYEKIPSVIANKLLEGKKTHEQMASERREAEVEKKIAPDFNLKSWEDQPDFVRDLIAKNIDAYKRMEEKTDEYNELVKKTVEASGEVETTFYYEPSSSAHATKGYGMMGWNLSYWRGWRMSPFESENPTDRQLEEFINTWSHERAHIFERSGSFSHNPSFYRKQAEALARLMHQSIK